MLTLTPQEHRPLPPPLVFESEAGSPMPEDVEGIAERVEGWGRVWNGEGSADDVGWGGKEAAVAEAPSAKPTAPNTVKGPDWDGFKDRPVGLEMQRPWAGHLLEGRKTIETRQYDLPRALLNRRIEVLESRRGQDGVSSLGEGNIFR